ncbi:hypothetical protein ACIBI3_35790 [Actinomadura luteofluorescens]
MTRAGPGARAGRLDVEVELDGASPRRAGIVRTARKVFDGTVSPRSSA